MDDGPNHDVIFVLGLGYCEYRCPSPEAVHEDLIRALRPLYHSLHNFPPSPFLSLSSLTPFSPMPDGHLILRTDSLTSVISDRLLLTSHKLKSEAANQEVSDPS